MNRHRIPIDRVSEFIQDYTANKMRTEDILKKYGCSWNTLYATLERCNIPKRGFRLTTANDAFFDILTPASSWVLGLWVTDGSVEHRGGYYSIRIGFSNEALTRIVHDLLETNVAISYSSSKRFWSFHVSSKRLYQALTGLGVVERKTFRTRLPVVPEACLPHLIRGIVDGDGSVYFRHRPRRTDQCYISIVSVSQMFIDDIQEHLQKAIGISGTIQASKNYYRLTFFHRESRILANWMYRDSEGLRYSEKYHRCAQLFSC
ncbi:MAG TPA: LAGLIDADG family homing endonuclease [Ktedonobacteraceae bacterium]|nr:LAGLIDADG family homing endonuclease [Ktedonobacteraceae bacterium]